MFSSLPKDLENIIMDYTYQLEHVEKFKESLNKINNIYYVYYENEEGLQLSRREIPQFLSRWFPSDTIKPEIVEYYHVNTSSAAGSLISSENTSTYHFLNIEHHYSSSTHYPTINLSRIHYKNKYRLEDLGTVYI